MRNFYVLTFDAAPLAQKTTFHDLRVEVDKSGTQVRTRTGYYALVQAHPEKANK